MMRSNVRTIWLLSIVLLVGCASPYRSDQGAMLGGLVGAGAGLAVGEATGNPLGGAILGAGLGALSGAVVGGSLDEIEARNRAEIEMRMGRPVPASAVTIADVAAMSQAGVPDEVIVTHIRNHGVAQPLQTNDILSLQMARVSPRVIQAMQTPDVPMGPPGTAIVAAPPPPVVIERHYWADPWGPPPPYRHRHRHWR